MLLMAMEAISSDTTVTAGTIALIGLPLLAGIYRVLRKLDRVCDRMDSVDSRMLETWSRKDQELFALKLRLRNTHLKLNVPGANAEDVYPDPPQED